MDQKEILLTQCFTTGVSFSSKIQNIFMGYFDPLNRSYNCKNNRFSVDQTDVSADMKTAFVTIGFESLQKLKFSSMWAPEFKTC